MRKLIILLIFGSLSQLTMADTLYQKPEAYLQETFATVPPASVLWLDAATQDQINKILGHPYPQARIRYWRDQAKTVWILEEVGKEFPITAGFTITNNHIADTRVLIYRESRGDEIHFPSFLKQFEGIYLDKDKLSGNIDSITGATLSVTAMRKMAQLALMLNALPK